MTKIEKEVYNIVEPIITQLDYILYDIEYLKEGEEWFLRIYIFKKDRSITLDDCETVHNAITDILDEKDPISTSYNLEISSCGVERKLKEKFHYELAINTLVHIKLFKPIDKLKEFEGTLVDVTDEGITIENNVKKQFKYEDISSAYTVFLFE